MTETDNSAPLMITVNVTDLNEPPGAPTNLSVSTSDDSPYYRHWT